MLESIWSLEHRPLREEERVRDLLEDLAHVTGFEPERYDLNQKENWRGYDTQRATVDLLTQRTQMMRIQGSDGESMAYIATGKHGEQPAVFLRVSTTLESLIDQWPVLFRRGTVESTRIDAPEWRLALAQATIQTAHWGGYLGMVQAWALASAPSWLEEWPFTPHEHAEKYTPEEFKGWMRVLKSDRTIYLELSKIAGLESEAHREAIEAVHKALKAPSAP